MCVQWVEERRAKGREDGGGGFTEREAGARRLLAAARSFVGTLSTMKSRCI